MKISLCLHTEKNQHNTSYEQAYHQFIELCVMADRAGFHQIWTGEHHAMNFAITPNPLLSLMDIAHRTTSIRLGTATLIAPLWHPLRLAEEIAYVDLACNGRLDIGLSKGAFTYEYQRLMSGLTSDIAGEMLRESVEVIKGLWRGNYAHQGKYWQFPETSAIPHRQLNHPPLWIAAQSPATVDFAIANDCHVQMTPLWFGEEKVNECIDIFHKAKHQYRKPAKLLLLRHVFITRDRRHKETVLKQFSQFYHEFFAWFNQSNPVSYGNLQGEIIKNEMFSPEQLEKNLLIGSATEVVEQLQQYNDQGVSEFALWLANGMSYQDNYQCLKQFSEEVLPHFK
ncbi:monooxygenase [Shewanella sp. NFH-SH190041]|uniref:LLM class flavin-dependent oxidoreductase n=1 Tax=Shewanella sp. NFH-SH190041 TaxID=2950245 RepID=UPI0021C3F21F|nr:LLM class flavin-dependent oxidoreductase [Shewanella sp. NFH-SH190041]BDM64208.1 monooxygenase [Shewanella sp. NFH-SH190041]